MKERRLLEAELTFTKTYQAYTGQDKALREAACMCVQMQYSIAPLRTNDYFAGQFISNRIGFYPLIVGNGIADGYDKCCYAADLVGTQKLLDEIKQDSSYSKEYIAAATQMLMFWQQEETYAHVKASFSDEMQADLADDYYHTSVGAVYPLYRIAGAHLDFKKLLTYGLDGLIAHIQEQDECTLYTAMVQVLEGIKDVIRTYIVHIESLSLNNSINSDRLATIHLSLNHLLHHPPHTLHQAMQLCMLYAVCAGTTELGRIDDYLGPFYTHDLQSGNITHEKAVMYVSNYFDMYATNFNRDSRCIIGGKGRHDEVSANAFCHLVMDAIEGKQLCLPQVSLRFYKGMDPTLYDRALTLLGQGNTFPILYNDDVNIKSTMHAMNVPLDIAEQYAFFGCGEFMLDHKSIGTPNTCLIMPKVLELVLNEGIDPVSGKKLGLPMPALTENTTFETLFENYKRNIDHFSTLCAKVQERIYDKCNEQGSFLLLSILHDDCIKRGKALFDGGLYHHSGTVETYGNITVADSLTAIKKVIFEDHIATLPELVMALRSNFEGYETLRYALDAAPKYGNDHTYADQIAQEVHTHVCESIRRQKHTTNLDSFLVVVINNKMSVIFGKSIGATPDGRLSGTYLSNGNAASPGKDTEGITALLNSLVKLDTSIHAGTNCNLKFSKTLFNEQRDKLKILLDTYFENGGQQTNISVLNQEDLEDAMQHPECYPNLMIRVGGFTARFTTLPPNVQQELIKRTAY